ncbi:MAG TPA: ring-cleaving dioxygenase [Flavitalea sp.]|nr:ring-cleaving dioxygenase [Flavitalea sp.]
MKTRHNGIHHITALSGDAQRNVDFYVKKLGMRLVKKSVNQDDPGTYHLFYGNGEGDPGSGLTFFPWPMARQGKPGVGEAVSVGLAVPAESMGFWAERFGEEGIDFEGPAERFGKTIWRFKDPDLMQLEFVFDEKVNDLPAWSGSTVPKEYGIRGFWGTTLRLQEAEPTAKVLTDVFGFNLTDEKGNQKLYATDAPFGSSVIIETADPKPSANGRGIVHHVAFRAKDDEDMEALRQKVIKMGLHPTGHIDRHWFHSVYFRSPGGVLFEIATDGPGYVVDEDADKLGQKLILPPWLEPNREIIEKSLPEIEVG